MIPMKDGVSNQKPQAGLLGASLLLRIAGHGLNRLAFATFNGERNYGSKNYHPFATPAWYGVNNGFGNLNKGE